MPSFIMPTSASLEQIAQKYIPTLMANDPVFGVFPDVAHDEYVVMWEQLDNFGGLLQLRGLNAPPPIVSPVGIKQYQVVPSVYGEESQIDERTMTIRREYGSFNKPVDVRDLVSERYRQLMVRYVARKSQLCWTLLTTGNYTALGKNGAVLAESSYTQRTFVATVPWATTATATPLADLRQVQLLSAGFSVNLGRDATAWMNRITANSILNNSNAVDIGGKRVLGGNTVNDFQNVGSILLNDDLPKIQVYDEGYYDDTNTFVRFIPNNTVVVVGKRYDGVPLGELCITRNAQAPGMAPILYTKVWQTGEYEIPNTVKLYLGANLCPALRFPSAIVVMTV